MWKVEFENIGNSHILRINAANYYAAGEESVTNLNICKSFDTEQESKAYFVSCAHTYMCGTFDILRIQLEGIAPVVFHGNVLHDLHRVDFIENWNTFLELKELFSSAGPSIWKRANLITDNYELIYSVIPKNEKLHYSYFLQLCKDLLRCSAQIKRALGDHIELAKKEWYEITNQDIELNYSPKNAVA